jgi:hypothetical protein
VSFWSTDFWAADFWADDFWTGLGAGGAPATGELSRKIGTSNQTEAATAGTVQEVVMVKLEFDTPVYAHSGFGNIPFDGNTYLGVGKLGAVSEARETEVLGPTPMQLQVSAVDAALLAEALDSGNFGDRVTIYIGYRQDDGTLVEAPWIAWRGTFEYAKVAVGDENVVAIICQHDLAVLDKSDGARYSNEDQRGRFANDTGFEFVAVIPTQKLIWAGGPISSGGGGGGTNSPPVYPR